MLSTLWITTNNTQNRHHRVDNITKVVPSKPWHYHIPTNAYFLLIVMLYYITSYWRIAFFALNFSLVFSFTLLPNFVVYACIELRPPLLDAPDLNAWPTWPRQLKWNLSFSLKTVPLMSPKIKIAKKYATLSDSVGTEPRAPGLTVKNVYHYTTDLMFKVLLWKYLKPPLTFLFHLGAKKRSFRVEIHQ